MSAIDPRARPPIEGDDESYTLSVPDPAKGDGVALLHAATYQGLLRGLETFSQLVLLSVLVSAGGGSGCRRAPGR